MSILIKLKRSAAPLSDLVAITPAEGEPVYSFQDKTLVIGDGSTTANLLPKIYAKTWQGDIIGTSYGGTGNSTGYIRVGLASGATAGSGSTAEGVNTNPSGSQAHAEGSATTASGAQSHAEGNTNTASGSASHAEGRNNTASASYAHVEGESNTASGVDSHAEGRSNTSSGSYSHAQGYSVTAKHRSQTALGEFNVLDPSTNNTSSKGTYIEIVGNGTSSSDRSNARTLDWSGNEQIAGNFLPMDSNEQQLGSSILRWKNVYVGSANTYGSTTTPIYWNNGVPEAVSSLTVNTTGSAAKITTARKLKVALGSTSDVTFDGSADQTNIPVSGTLKVGNGGTGMTTASYKNAVVIGNSTTVTNAMQTVRTASGAFYATAADAKPAFGVLPVAQGGTGQTAFDTTPTANSVKPVTSGGVKTAIDNLSSTVSAIKYAASSSVGGAANSVAKSITFNNSGSGAASGTSFNGSTARTISYNTVGAAAASHTHNYAGSSTAGGVANSAVKLANARTFRTNLGSTSTASFNGTANVTPGVTGTLGTGNGGTGKTSWTAKGVLYASSTSELSQVTPTQTSQILLSDSNMTPVWTTASTVVSNNNFVPPTSSAVYSAIQGIHIENLNSLKSMYIWDTLSTSTYYTISSSSGSSGSGQNPSVWKISTWTSCTAISATKLRLSGTRQVYTIGSDNGSTVTIPAGKYCLVETNSTASTYDTASQVFYTGDSSVTYQTIWQTVSAGAGGSVPGVWIDGTFYPAGSAGYANADVAAASGSSVEYGAMTIPSGSSNGLVKYYFSQSTGTILTAGGAKAASSSWQTEIGTSSMYTHGISGSTIHLCRGSLFDNLFKRIIFSYTGDGTETRTISLGTSVPRRLRIVRAYKTSSTQYDYYWREGIIDTVALNPSSTNRFNPAGGGYIETIRWTDNQCTSITITTDDTSGLNVSGVTYHCYAIE